MLLLQYHYSRYNHHHHYHHNVLIKYTTTSTLLPVRYWHLLQWYMIGLVSSLSVCFPIHTYTLLATPPTYTHSRWSGHLGWVTPAPSTRTRWASIGMALMRSIGSPTSWTTTPLETYPCLSISPPSGRPRIDNDIKITPKKNIFFRSIHTYIHTVECQNSAFELKVFESLHQDSRVTMQYYLCKKT